MTTPRRINLKPGEQVHVYIRGELILIAGEDQGNAENVLIDMPSDKFDYKWNQAASDKLRRQRS